MSRPTLPSGTELGGYLLQEPVGAGGMGTVYRAQDAEGRIVALKLLHPGITADPAARERLDREVKILQRLRIEGVAKILDAELEAADAFLVMEFIDGPSLADHVDEFGPLDPIDLADLAERLTSMIAEIHAAGIIHRDLKPANVVLSSTGPILIDFGIAQEAHATRLTGTGLVIGTPGYVAPELIAGSEPTRATDEWGLAAVVAFAATGRPPFGTGRFDEVLSRVAAGAADLAGLPPRWANPLRAALASHPHARLRSHELVDALADAARQDDPRFPTPTYDGGTHLPTTAYDGGPHPAYDSHLYPPIDPTREASPFANPADEPPGPTLWYNSLDANATRPVAPPPPPAPRSTAPRSAPTPLRHHPPPHNSPLRPHPLGRTPRSTPPIPPCSPPRRPLPRDLHPQLAHRHRPRRPVAVDGTHLCPRHRGDPPAACPPRSPLL